MAATRDRILGLKQVPLSMLRGFSGGNPKSPSDDDRQHLRDSLDNHGYVLPVAARQLGDGTFEIVDGHTRVAELTSRDPAASIKVLVLDVESVEEGARILLALKRTTDWDLSKLEAFVAEALANGAAAADLMADTGMVGTDLDAFSSAAAEFIDDRGDNDDTPNERPSRAGQRTEHVPFSVPVSREQSARISKALKLAKQIAGCKAHADALVEICSFYLAQNSKQTKTSKRKPRARAR
jgi:hypothetical protein